MTADQHTILIVQYLLPAGVMSYTLPTYRRALRYDLYTLYSEPAHEDLALCRGFVISINVVHYVF